MTDWRLPRQTGDLYADVMALRHAFETATTEEQRAACAVRFHQLWERLLPALEPMRDVLRQIGEAFTVAVEEVGRAWTAALRDVLPTSPLARIDVTRWERDGVDREAALAYRRTLGTGPALHRIDGRRRR